MNDTSAPEGLTGQQIAQVREQARAAIQHAIERINLRHKCLELAAQVCAGQPDKVVEVARAMYEFAAFPATEISIRIGNG
jgi:ABC-type branched-subunit amino acid transport system ATPase component